MVICPPSLAASVSTYLALLVLYVGPVLAEILLTRFSTGVGGATLGLSFVSPFLACRLRESEARQLLTLVLHALGSGAASLMILGWMALFFERVIRRQNVLA